MAASASRRRLVGWPLASGQHIPAGTRDGSSGRGAARAVATALVVVEPVVGAPDGSDDARARRTRGPADGRRDREALELGMLGQRALEGRRDLLAAAGLAGEERAELVA